MSSKNDRHDSSDDDAVEIDTDHQSADGGHTDEKASKSKIELEKAKSDYLYLLAEFDNYKKHAIKERSDLIKFGPERMVRELLEVVDNFERALSSDLNAENLTTFKEGVQLIHRELHSLLQRSGVTEVTAEGVPFDPTLHEALTSEETQKYPPGTVSRVFKKAYRLHDKLIRPAQVVVARAPSAEKAEG